MAVSLLSISAYKFYSGQIQKNLRPKLSEHSLVAHYNEQIGHTNSSHPPPIMKTVHPFPLSLRRHPSDALLLVDSIRAVNLKPEDGQRALVDRTSFDARPIHFADIAA